MDQAVYRSKAIGFDQIYGTSSLLGFRGLEGEIVPRYLARLAGDGYVFAAGRSQIRPLGGGFNNRLYEIESVAGIYVIKIYPVDRAQRLNCEFSAMELLAFLDAVPNVVMKDPEAVELRAPVLIYEKFPGLSVESSSMSLEDLEALLEIWSNVHDISISNSTPLAKPAGPANPEDCLRHIDERLHAMATSGAMKESRFRDAINRLNDQRRCLEMVNLNLALWTESVSKLCHGDCRPANLLRKGTGRIGLVDWEHAGIMDPFYEVAGFFWHPESIELATSVRDRALESYCERSDDPHSFEKMDVYQTILPFQWAVRILFLIADYNRQVVQPWNKIRSLDALWSDQDYYSRLACKKLATKLPGRRSTPDESFI